MYIMYTLYMICQNEHIEILELTDEYIKAKCSNCDREVELYRDDCTKEEWDRRVEIAKKHQEGFFDVPKA